MGYGSGEGPGHGGAMGGPGDAGPSGKGGDDGGSLGGGFGGDSGGFGGGGSEGNMGPAAMAQRAMAQKAQGMPGMTEAEFNSRLDKYIADKGLKSPSESQLEGVKRGNAGIEQYRVGYNNINSQFQSHWATVMGKPGIGTPERAKVEGVPYKQPSESRQGSIFPQTKKNRGKGNLPGLLRSYRERTGKDFVPVKKNALSAAQPPGVKKEI